MQLSDWAAQGDWRLYFLHRDRIEKSRPKTCRTSPRSTCAARTARWACSFRPTNRKRPKFPPTPDLAKLFEGYKGRAEIAAGEAFDVSPANIDARSQRTDAARGHQGRAAAEEDARRNGEPAARAALRHGRIRSRAMKRPPSLLPSLMVRGTKNLTRQQIQDELDKNRATLSAPGDTGTATFYDPDQAGQSAGRAQFAQANPARADAAGRRVRGPATAAACEPGRATDRSGQPGHHARAANGIALRQGRCALHSRRSKRKSSATRRSRSTR